MKRIIFDVPKWSLYLHRDSRGLPSAVPDDAPLRQLEDELFERLYAGEASPLGEKRVHRVLGEWARQLHAECDVLPDFARLAGEVRGDALMAALAVEKLVDQINPDLPPSPQSFRRQVSRGCSSASTSVDDAREAFEGLSGIGWSNERGATTPSKAREMLRRLHSDPRLRRIAEMAGRFKRIATGRLRQRVRHAQDEVCDIERGNDLARLLPTELGRLLHPRQRLLLLRDLHERSAAQYAMRGPEHLGRGPLVVCLDKSGSMDGSRDEWASAVALALLELAQREGRAFGLMAFDAEVKFSAFVSPRQPIPEETLFVGCSGGTDIHRTLSAALQAIRTEEPGMRKADVVLVSDGESDATDASTLRDAARSLGVSILGLAIQMPAEKLQPWCDEVQSISELNQLDAHTADKLFAE